MSQHDPDLKPFSMTRKDALRMLRWAAVAGVEDGPGRVGDADLTQRLVTWVRRRQEDER